MQGVQDPVDVFYSFAHEDEAFCIKLEKHLSLLRQQRWINNWHDRHLLPGADWARERSASIELASLILLLISPDFFASDYCSGIEMQRILERQQAGEAHIIPILLRPVDWNTAPFAHLQTLPTNNIPITGWDDPDAAFADVAVGIRRVIEAGICRKQKSAANALPLVTPSDSPKHSTSLGTSSEAHEDPEKKVKKRIQLDFSSKSLNRLDQLKELIGADTRAETIKQALRLFEWFVSETGPDDVITVSNRNGEIIAKFKAKLLHNAVRPE